MSKDDNARQKVFGALLANALLRWETLVTVMVTAILFLFVPNVNLALLDWQPWYWLALGALAETVLIAATLTDPEATEQAIAEDFEREYDLRNIRNRVSRERLRDAFEYRRNMLKLSDRSKGAMRNRLRTLVSDVSDWITYMYNLAERIDLSESNELVLRDRQQVPRKIADVEARIKRETNPTDKQSLEVQLHHLQRQQTSLEATLSSTKRAEIQLESTLSALGTVYAQMALLGAKAADSAKGQRLSIEVKDEIDKLQDTIDAMDEMQRWNQVFKPDYSYTADLQDESAPERLRDAAQAGLSLPPEDEAALRAQESQPSNASPAS